MKYKEYSADNDDNNFNAETNWYAFKIVRISKLLYY